MTSETLIGISPESIYTLLGGIAAIVGTATYFITKRLSTLTTRLDALTARLDDTIKNMDKSDDRIKYMEQLKMQESQPIIQNLVAELKKSIDDISKGSTSGGSSAGGESTNK